MPRKLITEWHRIGRSGKTVDGRDIEPQWLTDAAESYSTDLYTAMIWPDHKRWYNLGKIVELKTDANDEDGIDLLARMAPNDQYIWENRNDQRLFTSMELQPNFRDTGKHYLTGMGATDDPASAGTSEVHFSRIGSNDVVVADPEQLFVASPGQPDVPSPAGPIPDLEVEQMRGWFAKFMKAISPAAENSGVYQPTSGLNFNNPPDDVEDDDMSKPEFEKLQSDVAALTALFTKQFPDAVPAEPKTELATLQEQFAQLTEQLKPVIAKFSGDGGGDQGNPGDQGKPNEPTPAASAAQFTELQQGLAALTKQFNAALQEQAGTGGDEPTGGINLADEI